MQIHPRTSDLDFDLRKSGVSSCCIIEPNYLASGAEDRFLIRAHDGPDAAAPGSGAVIFYGSLAECLEVHENLARGAVTILEVQNQYIRDHPGTDAPDSPERFAADLNSHLSVLADNGVRVMPTYQDGTAFFLKCLEKGNFDSIQSILRAAAEHTGIPNAPLITRLEALRTQWKERLVYRVQPFFTEFAFDRAVVYACKNIDGKSEFYDSIFVGTKEHCRKLAQKLNNREITMEEVKDMISDDWPEASADSNGRQTHHETEQPRTPEEALYLVDGREYLHLRLTDTGVNYTFYEKDTMRRKDVGQLEYKDPARIPEDPLAAASHIVCAIESRAMPKLEQVSLDILEELLLKEKDSLWDTLLDEYPLPDGSMPIESLEENGYYGGDLMAVMPEKAAELFDRDFTLYAVTNGKPELVFDAEEISDFQSGVLYAIPRGEWETSQDFQKAVAERMDRQEEREKAFLDHRRDCFAIYQLRKGEETRDLRYMPFPAQGVNRTFYELAYTGELPPGQDQGILDVLWEQFNIRHPADYCRPSLSMSDIIALKQDGVVSCHYVDRAGFTAVHGFIQPENGLKDMKTKDYRMTGGIINSSPKEEPSVAGLEAQVKAGQAISLMDLSDALHRERSEKKSVMARLQDKPPVQEKKRTAPKRSAERER